ncbi:MAG: pyridoxal phosphate-dependent [Verrucomicrobia bacterium]|nr:MAG: pyridoxal phosphate-dependent [Verrucomicrobiota bacterium]
MRLANEAEINSPALVVHSERVTENIRRMVEVAGGTGRLRPHVKTHKLAQLVARQIGMGIHKFKCATFAEAEMVAETGGSDILLAQQPVGPNVKRLLKLIKKFPRTHFSTVVDDLGVVHELGRAAISEGSSVDVLMDLDVGQGRTGIKPGLGASGFYRVLSATRGLRAGGFHVYDGHIHESDPEERAEACEAAYAPVEKMRAELRAAGIPVPRIVAGGSPTFPMHARRSGVECSPGTCVLWDAGYGKNFRDLPFLPAATLLTRVISRPGQNRLCLDLGHKAVASEMAPPRVLFPALEGAVAVAHNEEHLVLDTVHASKFQVGSVLHGIPWHICPTVALYGTVQVASQGRVTEEWPVLARARRLSI